MKSPIDILMADDHPVYLEGLQQIIRADDAVRIVHAAGNGTDAVAKARELEPDIALLDVRMPGLTGLQIASIRQEEQLAFEVILLTAYQQEDIFNEALRLGVMGYVVKENAPSDILDAIHAVASGTPYVSPQMTKHLMERRSESEQLRSEVPGLDQLTRTERRILKLIASDRTSKEIANQLGVSPHTIESHRANISAKLELHGSHSLLKFAFEHRALL